MWVTSGKSLLETIGTSDNVTRLWIDRIKDIQGIQAAPDNLDSELSILTLHIQSLSSN